MRIQFNQDHISINQFNPIELNDFTVLTGVNGSGKSHLLEAIELQKATISGLEKAHIVRFNYETFKLDNEPAFNGQQLADECKSAWEYLQTIKLQIQTLRTQLGERYETLKTLSITEKKNFWDLLPNEVAAYKQGIKNLFKQNSRPAIYSLVKKLPYSIDEIQHDDFVRLYKPFIFKNNFLPHQLGKIFWNYHIKYFTNQVHEFENEKHGKNHNVLSENEFVSTHGEKPWDVINEILVSFDTLHYKVNSPEGLGLFDSFQLKLKHTEKNDVEIDFQGLSSGERILMALVASVYKSSADKHFPDILLLDEVDASLHPSMMKNMLEVIENIFLKQGVKVILVTHSPTTIALSPEESIYVMNRSGKNRIEKKSKQQALSILTQGFATIEQGLKFFDEVAKSNLTIVTEGNNALLISKALELHSVSGVEVLSGIENLSGKNQLKTLFDFFCKIPHKNKIIFVWDCDVSLHLQEQNNTFPHILSLNSENEVVKKGIENIFPQHLFEDFKKTITDSQGKKIVEFDDKRKRDFEKFIIERNQKDDFKNFSGLIYEINRIKEL